MVFSQVKHLAKMINGFESSETLIKMANDL